MYAQNTPKNNLTLSAELRNVIYERNILTTRSRMKVLTALTDLNTKSIAEQKNNMRCKAIQEILTSEVSYLRQLELIMTYFMNPLLDKNYFSPSVQASLFGNVETIYNVNGELLKELKRNPGNVASAFLKMAPYFKLYSVYAFDYKQMLMTLQNLVGSNPEFGSFIQNQENRPEVGTKLMSLLITPIQRIPRYRLLLKEVLTHTSTNHPDYAVLQGSLREVERAAEHINRLVEDQENMQKMIDLQRSLCGSKPKIVAPGRKLIKEGKLMKVSPHGRKAHPRYFLLFSDMLMYCKLLRLSSSEPNSLRCCCILPLKDCRVDEILSKGMFKLSCYNETLIMYSDSLEEGSKWVQALKEAVKQFHDCRQTLRKDSSSRRPMRRAEILNSFKFDLTDPANRKRKRLRRELEDVYQCDDHSNGKKCVSGVRFKTMKFKCHNPWKKIKLSRLLKHGSPSNEHPQEPQQRSPPKELKDSLYPLRSSLTAVSTSARQSVRRANLGCMPQVSSGIDANSTNQAFYSVNRLAVGQTNMTVNMVDTPVEGETNFAFNPVDIPVECQTNMAFDAVDTPLEGQTNMAFSAVDTPLEGQTNMAFNAVDTPLEGQINMAFRAVDAPLKGVTNTAFNAVVTPVEGLTNMAFNVDDTPLEGLTNMAFNPSAHNYNAVTRSSFPTHRPTDSQSVVLGDQTPKSNTEEVTSPNWHVHHLQKIKLFVSAFGRSIYKHFLRHNPTAPPPTL